MSSCLFKKKNQKKTTVSEFELYFSYIFLYFASTGKRRQILKSYSIFNISTSIQYMSLQFHAIIKSLLFFLRSELFIVVLMYNHLGRY